MYAIYARQSIERQDSVSIEAQIEQCKKCIPNAEIKVYKDVGFSGKNIKRPQFEQMLKDIESGNVDFVVSYRLDRVSRSITDFANLLNMFEKYNVKYISATEQFDTSSPMGRAMIYIVMVFAQLERETIAGRIEDNYRYRAKYGYFMGGNTPFGYDSQRIEISGKKVSILVPNNGAVLLQKIFDSFLSGESVYSICRTLNNNGYRTAKGSLWSAVAIKRVLSNISPCPADESVYNYLLAKGYEITNPKEDFTGENGMCIFFKNKNRHEETETEKQVAVIGLHKPVITSEQFIKAQQILTQKEPQHKKRSQKSFIAGLLKCAECGYSFGLKETQRGGKEYAYYYCRSRLSKGVCENDIYVPADELEKTIVNDCMDHLQWLIDNHTKIIKTNKKSLTPIDEIQTQIDNIIINIGKGNAVVDKLLTSKLTTLQAKLDELRAAEKATHTNNINIDDIESIQKQLKAFDTLTINNKIAIMRSVIKTVSISRNGGIEITYIF